MYVKHFYKNEMMSNSVRILQSKYSDIGKQLESKGPSTEPEIKESKPANKRKDKTVLLLCSYLGHKYYGSSILLENGKILYPTIQSELIKALHKAGAILDLHLANPMDTRIQTASRTDKGVSALMQVASVRMDVSKDYLESLNAALPPEIRVWQIQRTMQNFWPRRLCSTREYAYLCPSYAFNPKNTDHLEFRIQPESKLLLQELLTNYKGLHHFKNFTKRIKFDDNKGKKQILEASVEDTFVSNNMEFVLIRIIGNAFLLHQIRKMVGLVISVMKGHYPKSIFEEAFSNEEVPLPLAPALGLVLMYQAFPEYNKLLVKLGLQNKHPSLDIDMTHPKIQQFKNEVIFNHIIKSEVNELRMLEWLNSYLKNHFE